MSNTRAKLAQAFSLRHQGRLSEAAAIFRQVLASEPRNGDALHLLGVTMAGMGRTQEAADFISAAVEIQPSNPAWQANLGNALGELGRYAEAIAGYNRALALKPDLIAALRARGLAQLRLDQVDAALASLGQAVEIAPNDALAHNDLGVALEVAQRHQDALQSFSRAAVLNPNHPEPHYNRGKICLQFGHPAEALASFDRALTLAPTQFELHLRRGIALAMLERHEESLRSFDQAVSLDQTSAEAVNNRGVALGRVSRPEEALESFFKAVALKPDYADAFGNAANALKNLKKYREALDYFCRALAIKPNDPVNSWGKALVHLSLGEFREGWPLYESRLRLAHLRPLQRSFDSPRWSGNEELEGRTLLVHAEQGLGDTLQFCRYIRPLEARGATVVFEVQPVLRKLLSSLEIRGQLLATGEPLPRFDLFCPLLSLPLACRTELDGVPGGVPYLRADATAVQNWRGRLAPLQGLKVGINWQGNLEAEKQNSLRGRSFALAAAAPLAQVPNVQLISLQKGPGAMQRDQVEFGAAIAQLTDSLQMGPDEFADTAALVTALDLVITSDTALAHLAGALGVPVWVVLHAVPDWRWLTDRDDSPWYPTMRLFRQRQAGAWPEVFSRVAEAITALRLHDHR